MQTHEWKRRHQIGLVITQTLVTLLAPLWLPIWFLTWLVTCLNDETVQAFWPPFTRSMIVRCCGRELPSPDTAREHCESGCPAEPADLTPRPPVG